MSAATTAPLAADVNAATGVLQAAMAATHSPSDRIAYALDVALLEHPEWCSTDADYPGWTPGGAR